MLHRDDALALLRRHDLSASLMGHALASESIMRALAQHLHEDIELWGLTGLLHDLDYPETVHMPERHGLVSAEQLAESLPACACQAIRAHNGEHNGNMPVTRLDFALRCAESVTGLISAAARLRPDGYAGMEPKSIKKKMKDKAFAASVSRGNIRQCAELGLELDDFLRMAIAAMRELTLQ